MAPRSPPHTPPPSPPRSARYLKEDRTDIAAYMATEARSFVSLVHRVWRGGVVLGVDTTPMQPTASGTGWPPGTNTRAATINAAIVPIFQEAGWPVVNQHSINTNGTTNPADVTAVLAQQYEVRLAARVAAEGAGARAPVRSRAQGAGLLTPRCPPPPRPPHPPPHAGPRALPHLHHGGHPRGDVPQQGVLAACAVAGVPAAPGHVAGGVHAARCCGGAVTTHPPAHPPSDHPRGRALAGTVTRPHLHSRGRAPLRQPSRRARSTRAAASMPAHHPAHT